MQLLPHGCGIHINTIRAGARPLSGPFGAQRIHLVLLLGSRTLARTRGGVMLDRLYELAWTSEGIVARVRLRGNPVLISPLLNRGTAFTLGERDALGLTGLLPDGVSTIEGQLRRVYAQYQAQPDDLAKNILLGHVRDRNAVLFFRLLTEHMEEMLPIVYTPTVGTAIERYSLWFGRPRGVYLSVDHPDQVETAFRNYGRGPDEVDLIVATDSEGILGIGDWGV